MSISVVMVTMNREKRALRSLGAVLKQTVKPKEVIVVDSSNTKSLGRIGKKLFSKSRIKFIYINRKASMTEARNIGIKQSNAGKNDVILFIDDDIILNNDYIDNLTKGFGTKLN